MNDSDMRNPAYDGPIGIFEGYEEQSPMTDLTNLRNRTDEILDSVTVSKADFEELCLCLERVSVFLRGEQLADALLREGDITLSEYVNRTLAKVRK